MLILLAIGSAAVLLVLTALSRNDDTRLMLKIGVIAVIVLGMVGQTVSALVDSLTRR